MSLFKITKDMPVRALTDKERQEMKILEEANHAYWDAVGPLLKAYNKAKAAHDAIYDAKIAALRSDDCCEDCKKGE